MKNKTDSPKQDIADPATECDFLIIDDNKNNLEVLKQILEDYGYKVYTALSGSEGIDIAFKCRPKVVLMDLSMPIMDGFKTTEIIKQHPLGAEMIVIACSALETEEAQEKSLAAGCAGFINKSIEPHLFLAQIQKIISDSTKNT